MNQGKMWLVVKPTVGLPLFLGGVATIAVIVHLAILSHTTWFPGYHQGKAKAAATASADAPAVVAAAEDKTAAKK